MEKRRKTRTAKRKGKMGWRKWKRKKDTRTYASTKVRADNGRERERERERERVEKRKKGKLKTNNRSKAIKEERNKEG